MVSDAMDDVSMWKGTIRERVLRGQRRYGACVAALDGQAYCKLRPTPGCEKESVAMRVVWRQGAQRRQTIHGVTHGTAFHSPFCADC